MQAPAGDRRKIEFQGCIKPPSWAREVRRGHALLQWDRGYSARWCALDTPSSMGMARTPTPAEGKAIRGTRMSNAVIPSPPHAGNPTYRTPSRERPVQAVRIRLSAISRRPDRGQAGRRSVRESRPAAPGHIRSRIMAGPQGKPPGPTTIEMQHRGLFLRGSKPADKDNWPGVGARRSLGSARGWPRRYMCFRFNLSVSSRLDTPCANILWPVG